MKHLQRVMSFAEWFAHYYPRLGTSEMMSKFKEWQEYRNQTRDENERIVNDRKRRTGK